MALGSLTKQLAAQALGNSLDSMLEKPAAAIQPDSLAAVILAQVQAMQRALKDDQELTVRAKAGVEDLRILEIYVPSEQVLVLTGLDGDQNVTRLIAPVESVQLVCKVKKVDAGAKPVRITFLTPKRKPE